MARPDRGFPTPAFFVSHRAICRLRTQKPPLGRTFIVCPTSMRRCSRCVRSCRGCLLPRTCDDQLVAQAVHDRFDFISVPLMHPRFRRDDSGVSDARTGPGTRTHSVLHAGGPITYTRGAGSDLLLDSRHWTTAVVGKMSPWLRLDSPCASVRNSSVKVCRRSGVIRAQAASLRVMDRHSSKSLRGPRTWASRPLLPPSLISDASIMRTTSTRRWLRRAT